MSAEAWGSIGTVAGTLGMGVSLIYSRIAAADKRAHDLETEQIQKDVARVDASLKASWLALDDLRFNAVRKQDQDKMRDEFRADVKALGDRLEAAIASLRADLHRAPPIP